MLRETNRIKQSGSFLLGCALALGLGAPAHAQDDLYPSSETSAPATGPAPSAQSAEAPEGPYPSNYVERPIVLTRGMLRVDAAINHWRFQVSTAAGSVSANATEMRFGAGFGITDDIEAGISYQAIASPLALGMASTGGFRLQIDPTFDLGDIGAYGRYRLARGQLEAAVEAGVSLPIQTDFAFWVAAPIRYTMGALALDTGLALALFLPSGLTILNVLLPIRPRFALTPALYAGLDTGLQLQLLDGDGWSIPLGLETGYVLQVGGSPLDIFLNFSFLSFLSKESDGVQTSLWNLLIGIRFHTLTAS